MAAHRRSDQHRVYLYAGGLRKRAWSCTAVAWNDWLGRSEPCLRGNTLRARARGIRRFASTSQPGLLLIVQNRLRRKFGRLKLCAHLLDLRRLLVEMRSDLRSRCRSLDEPSKPKSHPDSNQVPLSAAAHDLVKDRSILTILAHVGRGKWPL